MHDNLVPRAFPFKGKALGTRLAEGMSYPAQDSSAPYPPLSQYSGPAYPTAIPPYNTTRSALHKHE